MQEGKKGLYIELDAELYKELKISAARTEKSLSWIIAKLVRIYLEETKK